MKALVAVALALLGAACAVPPDPRPAGRADTAQRPADKALVAGIRAYEDGQYAEAEKQLGAAVKAGLGAPKDRATANKHLAFIYCTTSRVASCEAAFRAARQADPSFALSRSEAGHPLWGPVYRKALP
jgi:Tfp pilus assembly protein PilF